MRNRKVKDERGIAILDNAAPFAVLAMTMVLLVACGTTKSGYIPALHEGDVGYTESQLSSDRFRVVYRGDSGVARDKVQDYALLRAAELTVAQNYDWFEIAERSTIPEVEPVREARGAVQVSTGTSRQTRCGLIGCTTTETVAAPAFPQSEAEFASRDSSYVASLEVLLGEGSHEHSANIYDAREVIASIRAKF